MTYDKAVSVAKAYLNAERFPYSEYRYVLTTCRPITEGWYFDFSIERVDGEPLQVPRDAIGGAPGFKVVAGSGEVQIVSWEEYHRWNTAAG